jgi:hypothetical protein
MFPHVFDQVNGWYRCEGLLVVGLLFRCAAVLSSTLLSRTCAAVVVLALHSRPYLSALLIWLVSCCLLLPRPCVAHCAPCHRTLPQRLAAMSQWRIIPLVLIAGLVGPLICPVVVLWALLSFLSI